MDLSIVILNYKSINFIRQQLRFFYSLQVSFTFEVIVIDNASGDPIEALKMDYPEVRIIALPKNVGMGAGNNAGIAASRGDNILILNPDVIVLPHSIETLMAFLKDNPSVGMVGPKLLNPDGTLQYSCFRFHRVHTPLVRRTKVSFFEFGRRELGRFLMLDWDHHTVLPVDWLLGAAIMIRQSAVQEVGSFDERFFLFLEDTDLCRRFGQRGWEVVYNPHAQMIHYPHRLSSSESLTHLLRKVTLIHIISWLKYNWKWRNTHAYSKSF